MYTAAFGQNNYIEYYEAFQNQTEMGSEVWMIVLKGDVMNATTGNGVLCHELHKKCQIAFQIEGKERQLVQLNRPL